MLPGKVSHKTRELLSPVLTDPLLLFYIERRFQLIPSAPFERAVIAAVATAQEKLLSTRCFINLSLTGRVNKTKLVLAGAEFLQGIWRGHGEDSVLETGYTMSRKSFRSKILLHLLRIINSCCPGVPRKINKHWLHLFEGIFLSFLLLMMIGSELSAVAAHFSSFVLSAASENRAAQGEDSKCAHIGAAEGWKASKSWERGKQQHHPLSRVKFHGAGFWPSPKTPFPSSCLDDHCHSPFIHRWLQREWE